MMDDKMKFTRKSFSLTVVLQKHFLIGICLPQALPHARRRDNIIVGEVPGDLRLGKKAEFIRSKDEGGRSPLITITF
jgi:hypothetical protein